MRKCLRCECEMQEGLALYSTDSHWRVTAAQPRALFPKEVGKLCCAVCPRCGYTELYVERDGAEKNPQGGIL